MVRQVTTNQVGDRLNVAGVSTLIRPSAVLSLQRYLASMTVDPRTSDYTVRIARATRTGRASRPGQPAGRDLIGARCPGPGHDLAVAIS
jgi:hypothetical protein